MGLTTTHVVARLRKARDIIANERWMKGAICNLSKSGQVSVCAAGAVLVADPNVKVTGYGVYSGKYNEPIYNACVAELDKTVKERHPQVDSIVEFNDRSATKDKRYVLREFDATIKRLTTAA